MLLCMFTVVGNIWLAAASTPITVGQTLGVHYDYSTIQDAIDNALGGDTITVDAGTYQENLVIDHSVNLIGTNPVSTFIDGETTATTVTITAADVSVSGFTILNGGGGFTGEGGSRGGDGICITGDNNRITGNTITANQMNGVEIVGSNNVVSGNTITANPGGGVKVATRFSSMPSSYNTVSGNHISGCSGNSIIVEGDYNTVSANTLVNGEYGLSISGSYSSAQNNQISGFSRAMSVDGDHMDVLSNWFDNNYYGVFVTGLTNSLIQDNVIGNTQYNDFGLCGALTVYYSDGNTIASNQIFGSLQDGMYFFQCNQNIIRNNYLTSNGIDSIDLESSNYNYLLQNTILPSAVTGTDEYTRDNHYDGIRLFQSSSNIIAGSTIKYNLNAGILLSNESDNNQILSNILQNNKVGVEAFYYCSGNQISSNTISYNSVGTGAFGIYLCESVTHTEVSANYISHNYNGIYLFDNAAYNTIHGNSICDNGVADSVNGGDGVAIAGMYPGGFLTPTPNMQCHDNTIYGNNIAGNLGSGVSIKGWGQLDSSSNSVNDNNIVHDNNILNNHQYGVTIYESSFNHIYHNNLINNGADSGSVLNGYSTRATNSWDNGYPSGGNYWGDWKTYVGPADDFTGPNQDQGGPHTSDGIADHYYPLMPADETTDKDNYLLTNPIGGIDAQGTGSVPTDVNGDILANYQFGNTGVGVDVHSSNSGSADVNVIKYEGSQPPGTGNILTGGTYFDIKVTPSSGTDLGDDAMVTISITDPSINMQSVLSYWDDVTGAWLQAQNQQHPSLHTITGEVPASALTGTPVMISQKTTLTVSCSPTHVDTLAGPMQTVITGKLTLDADNSGIAGETITLSFSTDQLTWQTIGTTATAADGTYTFTWDLSASAIPNGLYYIKADFAGDG